MPGKVILGESEVVKRDYYEVLGLSRGASDEDVRRAFRRLSKTRHPDGGGSEAAFKELTEAHKALQPEKRRAAYDQYGHAGAQAYEEWELGGKKGHWQSYIGRGATPATSRADTFGSLFAGLFTHGGASRVWETAASEAIFRPAEKPEGNHTFPDFTAATPDDVLRALNSGHDSYGVVSDVWTLFHRREDLLKATASKALKIVSGQASNDTLVRTIFAGVRTKDIHLVSGDLDGITDPEILAHASREEGLLADRHVVALCEAYAGRAERIAGNLKTIYANQPDLITNTAHAAFAICEGEFRYTPVSELVGYMADKVRAGTPLMADVVRGAGPNVQRRFKRVKLQHPPGTRKFDKAIGWLFG